MTEETLRSMVEQLVRELAEEPRVTAENGKTDRGGREKAKPETGCIPDITQVNLREQYLVEKAADAEAFRDLKRRTPARIGLGRAGARYKTATLLRFRADHAAAQDSVFSMVAEDFPQKHGYVAVKTLCESKDEYLTRPDKGRRFDEENQAILKQALGEKPKVVLAVGDGLSSAAIEANAATCAEAIAEGLKSYGISVGKVPFVKFCRVGAGDHIGEITGAELVCMLVGERPGLVTAESMSAYITYRPRLGVAESKRTVVSNIHKGGTPAVEAGAHIAELIRTILEEKVSGVELVRS